MLMCIKKLSPKSEVKVSIMILDVKTLVYIRGIPTDFITFIVS